MIKSLELMNDGYTWMVDIDLEKVFDTVNHDKLMRLISNTIKDGDVISLIRKFLVSGVMMDVRYADDCLILVKSEKAANRGMKNMTKYLEETLGLKVNVMKSKVERPSRIKFLGFGFFWDKSADQFKAKPH